MHDEERCRALVVFGVAAVVILPSLALLYVLDQRSLLPEEGVEPGPAARESPFDLAERADR
jgi:hypothetical protein